MPSHSSLPLFLSFLFFSSRVNSLIGVFLSLTVEMASPTMVPLAVERMAAAVDVSTRRSNVRSGCAKGIGGGDMEL